MRPTVLTPIITAATLLTALLLASPALALHPEESSEIENLKRRIEALEAERAEPSAPLVLEALSKKLTISGLLELEAVYSKGEGAEESSDLALATAQLGVEATISEHVGGHIVLLHEEGGEDSIEVDEAVIAILCPGDTCGEFSLSAGKMYLPFGAFNSHLISDPLTLELGEANNTAAHLGWSPAKNINLTVGVFSGEVDTAGDNDAIDSWVAAVEVAPIDGLTFGASYISDLAESDAGLVADEEFYTASVAGASAFVSATCGALTLEGEYLTALERFDGAVVAAGAADDDYEGGLTGRKPSAWNIELAYAPEERWEVAARIERANDYQDDLVRYGAAASYGLFEHTVLALEYLAGDAHGADVDRSHTVTAQLAFEF